LKIHNQINHRNHFNHSSDRGGFSLIELVFAMMFLTIIILGVVSLQTSNLAMMNGQKNQIQAHFLAVQGTQIAKGLGYTTIQSQIATCAISCYIKKLDPNTGPYQISNEPENIPVGNQIFQRKIQALNFGAANAYKIRSIVEWEDATGPHYEKDPITDEAMNSHVETDLIVFN
jgi:type II secretory pathway pseudopilin PulG